MVTTKIATKTNTKNTRFKAFESNIQQIQIEVTYFIKAYK